MSDLDPLLLARIQFAANISFHILFPTISIGLCWVLLYFRARFTASGDKDWEYAYHFWVKMFALTFAIGVVSGVTMSSGTSCCFSKPSSQMPIMKPNRLQVTAVSTRNRIIQKG